MASTVDASSDAVSRDSRAAQFHSFHRFQSQQSDWVPFEPTKPSGMSTPQIETLAEGLASELNYVPGTDIRELVVRIGGKLLSTPVLGVSDGADGTLLLRPDSTNFVIVLPVRASSRQDQLAVAKLLGHYFLHYRFFQIETEGKASRPTPARAQREALLFALAFLMPAEAFSRAYELAHGKMDVVAASFGVPFEAAELRHRRLQIRAK
jgi:predicted transcriptional regulator